MTERAKKTKTNYRGKAWIRNDTIAVIKSLLHGADTLNTMAVMSRHLQHAGLVDIVGVLVDTSTRAISITAIDPQVNSKVPLHRNHVGTRMLPNNEKIQGVAGTPEITSAEHRALIGFSILVFVEGNGNEQLAVVHGAPNTERSLGHMLASVLEGKHTDDGSVIRARCETRAILNTARAFNLDAIRSEAYRYTFDESGFARTDFMYVVKPVQDIAEAFRILREQLFADIDVIDRVRTKKTEEVAAAQRALTQATDTTIRLTHLALANPSMRRSQTTDKTEGK